jgi:small-conductance mechanosensitive channel
MLVDTNNLKKVLLKKCVEEAFDYANSGPGESHWYEKNMKKEFKDVCDAVRENQHDGDNYQLIQLKTGVGGAAARAYAAVCKLLDGKTYYENQDENNEGEHNRRGRFYLLSDMVEPVFCPLIYHMIREPKQIMTTKSDFDKIEEQFVLHKLYDHQEESCDATDEDIISSVECEVRCEISDMKYEIVQEAYEELPFQIQKVMYNFEHLKEEEEEEEIIFSETFTDKYGNECKGEILKVKHRCEYEKILTPIELRENIIGKKRKHK